MIVSIRNNLKWEDEPKEADAPTVDGPANLPDVLLLHCQEARNNIPLLINFNLNQF